VLEYIFIYNIFNVATIIGELKMNILHQTGGYWYCAI